MKKTVVHRFFATLKSLRSGSSTSDVHLKNVFCLPPTTVLLFSGRCQFVNFGRKNQKFCACKIIGIRVEYISRAFQKCILFAFSCCNTLFRTLSILVKKSKFVCFQNHWDPGWVHLTHIPKMYFVRLQLLYYSFPSIVNFVQILLLIELCCKYSANVALLMNCATATLEHRQKFWSVFEFFTYEL